MTSVTETAMSSAAAAASAEYFERVAGEWDNLRAGYFGQAVRDAAISRAYLRPEMAVADVGSGTGFLATGLAPLVAKVYAVDGSAAMLEAGKQNLAGFSNVEQRLADGTALPFEDATLDAVFANMYLHHCPDPEASIKEMVRVLKPGGRLVITDMDQHEHTWLRDEMADVWLGFDRRAMRDWFRAAGLVNVIVDATRQTCSSKSQSKQGETMADISIFVATGSRRVSGAQAAVRASYGALAESGCCGDTAAKTSCCGTSDAATSTSCCGTSDTAASHAMELVETGQADVVLYDTGYTAEQLAAVPLDAANMSLGCGNPTAMASLKPGETVFDIGSGAGIDALYAARRVGAAGRVIGLDMTPSMIERARRNAAEAGLGQVEFRLGQAEAMPVEDGTVDVILSNCVINLAEDKGRVFEEAYRVLTPGGRVSISDMVTAGPLPMSVRSDPQMWAGCINGALPEPEYLDLVRQAGFVDVVGKRSLSGGQLEGVEVYSLAVSARKA
ncbi:MAG: arsenite methyltransferase [Nitrososphaerales archaeon]